MPERLSPRGTCYPGARKIFVNTDGTFHICEKMGLRYPLGSIDEGLDFNRTDALLDEYLRIKNASCRDCWAARLCSTCALSCKGPEGLSENSLLAKCGSIKGALVNALGMYVRLVQQDHDTPRKALKREYKEALKEAVAGWSILCEDGLKQDIFLEADIFDEWKALDLFRVPYMISFFLKIVPLGTTMIIDRLKKENPRRGFFEIDTIDDLRDTRTELFRHYLPEPLGMNSLLYMYPSSTRVKRYLFEAETAIRYTHEKGLRELHLIVGCEHELPLKYLLTRQDKIQEFKSRIGGLTE